MKLYSVELIIHQAAKAFRRFPMALICAILAAACMIHLVDDKAGMKENVDLYYIIQTLLLGMVAYVGLSVFSQRYTMRTSTVILLNIALAGLMVYYFYAQPEYFTVKSVTRFFILVLAAHLGVSFAPFLVNTEVNGFWQYNKSLFLRFLTSSIYSVVFYIGLSVALLAITTLFNVDFGEKIYIYLLITVAVILNTWFFLSGVPSRVIGLEQVRDYPKGLRIFTQYVLLPLVVIYLVILYFYEAKILFSLVWPRGFVSYLIIGFSTLGILALLLVWPLRDDAEHGWIRTFTKRFFLALFPLVVLLILAVGRRVMEYGVTENRYFLIVLSLWLLIVALYFLFSRRKHIKFVPLSLFFAALLSGFGPWNAYQVSSISQHKRLEHFLAKNNMLRDGKAVKAKKGIKKDDEKEISSIVDYMIEVHGVESIQDLFSQNLAKVTEYKNDEYVNKTERVLDIIGIDSNVAYAQMEEPSVTRFDYSCYRKDGVFVNGYDYYLPVNIYPDDNEYSDITDLDSLSFRVSCDPKSFALLVKMNKLSADTISLQPMFDKLHSLYGKNDASADKSLMDIKVEGKNYNYYLELSGMAISNDKDNGENKLSSVRGFMLVKRKSAQ